MVDRLFEFSLYDLIARAMQEDHAAEWAESPEAAIAHRKLAKLLRQRADEVLAKSVSRLDRASDWR